MPRAGLDQATVVAAAAELADDVGFSNLTMGLLAQRLGVRAPSLYKHIASQAELNHRIATLVGHETADAVGTAIQGRAGTEALAAAMHALRQYILAHPGRYTATLHTHPDGPDDPMTHAADRLMDALRSILRSYPIDPDHMTHALRTLRSVFHGYAVIEAAHGFQWATDIDQSYDYLINLVDRGLRSGATADPTRGESPKHP